MLNWKSSMGFVSVHVWLCAIPAQADEWRLLAEQISYVNYGDFLYNRPPRNLGEADSPRLNALQAAMAIPADLPELKKRVEHADPKIRALALMKLYVSGDPDAFRVIHRRLGDEGVAFPLQSSFGSGVSFDFELRKFTPPKIETQEHKVGDLARSMLGMIDCPHDEDFEAWAKQRLDNPDWIGWYGFLLKRITRGTSPVPEGIEEELAAFGKLLDQRPPALRAWLGFVVADEAMSVPKEDTVLGTRDELIEKGKAPGPDALLGFLRDGSRAGLRQPNADKSKKGIRFILRHAKHLFRPEDAGTLREMGHYIAAADLRPEMAPLWIREACDQWSGTYQGWDRARAMAALLALHGEKESEFVIDWLYATEAISSGTSDQTVFITEYHRRRPEDWRKSMEVLVAHPGFDSIDTVSLRYLAVMVNDLNGAMLVDQALLTDERETELRNAVRRGLGLAVKPVRWIDLNEEGETVASKWTVPIDGRATHIALGADGGFLAVAHDDGRIRIHRGRGGEFLGAIPADDAGLATIGFRKADGRLIVVRAAGILEVWDAPRLRLESEVKLVGFGTSEACLDPAGEWLASRQANEVGISVHDVRTGERRWNIPMRIRAFGLIGASPDGSRFAVCDDFVRTVLLFDPANGKPLARLDGHSGVPKDVAFSTDGTMMVTSGEDTKIMVWNAKTGARVAEFSSRQRHSRVEACSGDSNSFFFGGSSGKITRVDLTDGRVVQSLKFDGTWIQNMARTNKEVVAVVHTAGAGSALVGWRLPED